MSEATTDETRAALAGRASSELLGTAETAKPERACVLVAKIEADTPAEMAAALESIALQIHTGELGEMQVSGGYGSGWSVEYRQTEGPTHEEYVKELTEYLGRSS